MQYIRKIVFILIAVLFISAVAIGMGVMFSVKNINVTLMSYVYSEDDEMAAQEIADIKDKLSSSLRGALLATVNEDKIFAALNGDKYTLEAFDKVYPCTVNVTVKERKETFAVASSEGYLLYDENGRYLKISDGYLNSFDNAPNILIDGMDTVEDIVEIAGVCALFKEEFSSLRSVVERVQLIRSGIVSGTDKIVFYLRCGVSVELQEYRVKTEEKISMVFSRYEDLSGEQKLGGKIYCFTTADGSVSTAYDKNG